MHEPLDTLRQFHHQFDMLTHLGSANPQHPREISLVLHSEVLETLGVVSEVNMREILPRDVLSYIED